MGNSTRISRIAATSSWSVATRGAAAGVPDEHSGEIVVAYVVRKDPALTIDELRQFCRENLTGYKVPRRIEFRETLPKTNVGKVLRRALKEEVEKG